MKSVAKQVQVKKPIGYIVEWTKTGFSAYSKNHPVVTTGGTLQELKRNIVEAMNLLLEDEGVHVASKDILLNMDMRHFFKKYSTAAEAIGLDATTLCDALSMYTWESQGLQ